MKILYLGNFNNSFNNAAEESIQRALEEMGHEVIAFDEKDFKRKDLWSASKKADLFLFFKLGIGHGVSNEDMIEILSGIDDKCIKVCWYWDKIWGNRYEFMRTIIPLTDFIFMTDGTFFRRLNLVNIYDLKQAVDKYACYLGEKKKKFDIDVVFPGSVYGERDGWAQSTQNALGHKFQVINGVFDEELNGLCNSAKIFISPKFPMNDFYWSNRVYQIIGRGGFMIHPRLHGLKKEFEDGKHIVYYDDFNDMIEKVKYYLEHPKERDKIRTAGMKKCKKEHTYHDALKNMFKVIKNSI